MHAAPHHTRSTLAASWAAFALALSSVAGCADGAAVSCRVGADCASGMCRSDGTCVVAVDSGAGSVDGGTTSEPDAATTVEVDAYVPPGTDSGVRVCSPNHDGVVTRDESPLRAGLYATFRIATDATVDTVGTTVDGERHWDLTGSLSGDTDQRVELLSPEGTWWSGDFPTATYATALSSESDNLGVFQLDEDGLSLLGLVSPESGLYQTKLTYDPPIPVLQFPLSEGQTWSVTSTVSGTALGVVSYYTESYAFSVDARGVMETPFADIDVLRVRSDLTRTSGFATLDSRHSYAFVSECTGTVATIQSQSFESSASFTDASEVRRLAP